jgi:hypothetical protein
LGLKFGFLSAIGKSAPEQYTPVISKVCDIIETPANYRLLFAPLPLLSGVTSAWQARPWPDRRDEDILKILNWLAAQELEVC